VYRRVDQVRAIPPNHRIRIPRRLAFFDTEAWVTPEAGGTSHRFRLGVVRLVELDGDLQVRRERTVVCHSPHEVWQAILAWTAKGHSVVAYAHNATYDVMVAGALRYMWERGWELRRLTYRHHGVVFSWRKGSRTLTVVDSMNIFPLALSQVGRVLGMEKLPMPPPDAPEDAWVEYCHRDVDILEKAILSWFRFVREHDLGSVKPTLAGQAMAAFRHRFMRHKILATRDPVVMEMELESYRGGRCEAFYIGEVPTEEVYKLDVNSMYPYVMTAYHHPLSPLWYGEDIPIATLRRLSQDYWLMVDGLVDTREPAYGIKRKDMLVFPVGRFRAILCGEEVRYALAHGHLRKALRVAIYRQGRPFHDYVTFFWELRRRAKEMGDEVMNLCAKLMLNSLYGKFAQRGYRMEVDTLPIPLGFACEMAVDVKTEKEWTRLTIGHQVIDIITEGVGWLAFPAMASSITAAARIYLWQLIKEAGPDNVYYCDTDSLFVNREGYRRLREHIDNQALGKLKLEGVSSYMVIGGAKNYVFGPLTRAAGRGNIVDYAPDGTPIVEKWLRLPSLLKMGLVEGMATVYLPWRHKGDYQKGVVGKDGQVRPLSLKEW